MERTGAVRIGLVCFSLVMLAAAPHATHAERNGVRRPPSCAGESLGQQGYTGHREEVYERIIRVPLIIRMPGRVPAGMRLDATGATDRSDADDPAASRALARRRAGDLLVIQKANGGEGLVDWSTEIHTWWQQNDRLRADDFTLSPEHVERLRSLGYIRR